MNDEINDQTNAGEKKKEIELYEAVVVASNERSYFVASIGMCVWVFVSVFLFRVLSLCIFNFFTSVSKLKFNDP